MKLYRAFLLSSAILLAFQELTSALNLMKGSGGHTAVELLLATGILAKLLNIKNKVGTHRIMHALLGGYRYPPRFHPHYGFNGQPRYPSPSLLDDEILDQQHAPLPLTSNHAGLEHDLMVNEETSHLMTKAHMFMPSDYQLYAPAPLFSATDAHHMLSSPDVQQILAARRARKLLAAQQARRLIAAQQIRRLLQARQLLAAQEAQEMIAAQSRRNILAASANNHRHFIPNTESAESGEIVEAAHGSPPQMITTRSTEEPEMAQIITADQLRQILAADNTRSFLTSSGPHTIVSSSAFPILETDNETKQIISLRRHENDLFEHGLVMKYHII